MMHKFLILSLFLGICLPCGAEKNASVDAVVRAFALAVDQQDGVVLREVFRPDAAIFATNPAGDALINVSAGDFARLHEEKRFGGAERRVVIDSVAIVDDLLANVKLRAFNDSLHYTYFLGLAKLNGEWQIQTFLQRSRATDPDP